VSGQISSVNYTVKQLQFENSGNVYSANLTYYGGTSNNGSAYWATGFSLTVLNNENYSVSIIFYTGTNAGSTFGDFRKPTQSVF
jgi:hypothetical protein